jgi:hypothetical protein
MNEKYAQLFKLMDFCDLDSVRISWLPGDIHPNNDSERLLKSLYRPVQHFFLERNGSLLLVGHADWLKPAIKQQFDMFDIIVDRAFDTLKNAAFKKANNAIIKKLTENHLIDAGLEFLVKGD